MSAGQEVKSMIEKFGDSFVPTRPNRAFGIFLSITDMETMSEEQIKSYIEHDYFFSCDYIGAYEDILDVAKENELLTRLYHIACAYTKKFEEENYN